MTKLKIGIDARCLEWRRGGVARIIINILKYWSKSVDHKFILYFQNYIPDDKFLRHPNFQLKLITGSKLIRKYRILAEQILMPFQLKRDNLDIFFATLYSSPLMYRSSKIVVAAWDISYTTHPKHYSFFHHLSLSIFSKKSCKIADGVITASTFDAQQINKFYEVAKEKILVTYLAPDKRFSKNIDKNEIIRVIKKYNLPSKFFLSMGVIQNRRNIDVIINSFKKIRSEFPDYNFVLIGRNYTHPFINLDNMLEDLLIEKRAIYIPWADDEDLPALYRAAEFYICTSTVDGETIMLKESMLSGTPVVTSPLLLDAIGGNGLIINDPENMHDTIKTLRLAMSKKYDRKKLIKDGIIWCRKITWKSLAKNILDFLESR